MDMGKPDNGIVQFSMRKVKDNEFFVAVAVVFVYCSDDGCVFIERDLDLLWLPTNGRKNFCRVSSQCAKAPASSFLYQFIKLVVGQCSGERSFILNDFILYQQTGFFIVAE